MDLAEPATNNKTTFAVPQISHNELSSYHETHFSLEAVTDFGQNFLNPAAYEASLDQPYDEWEEEDDLGYYEDGVKRTLTDEQIEIFRHSELRELRRQQEKQSESKAKLSPDAAASDTNPASLLVQDSNLPSTHKKKKKKNKSKTSRPEPKPDLRKRTWDVVEAGLDSLDYD